MKILQKGLLWLGLLLLNFTLLQASPQDDALYDVNCKVVTSVSDVNKSKLVIEITNKSSDQISLVLWTQSADGLQFSTLINNKWVPLHDYKAELKGLISVRLEIIPSKGTYKTEMSLDSTEKARLTNSDVKLTFCVSVSPTLARQIETKPMKIQSTTEVIP